MGALRKLKEQPIIPELRTLKGNNEYEPNPILLLFLFIGLLVVVLIIFKANEPEPETIESFIEQSLTVKDKQLKYDLCNVTTKQASHIKELTGKDVTGFKWVMDNYTLRHVLKHKDIGLNDYKKLCISFNTYDSLKLATRHLKDVNKLEMYKTYDNLIKIIIEVRKKELYILTMYKVY